MCWVNEEDYAFDMSKSKQNFLCLISPHDEYPAKRNGRQLKGLQAAANLIRSRHRVMA